MPTASGVVAIVEDDASVRRSIVRLLHAMGYGTAAFASAEAFLAGASLEGILALVLDIHLGGMSGIELRRRLAVAGASMPVIYITAFDDAGTRMEAMATGCVDCLQKPFDAHRLAQALERARTERDG